MTEENAKELEKTIFYHPTVVHLSHGPMGSLRQWLKWIKKSSSSNDGNHHLLTLSRLILTQTRLFRLGTIDKDNDDDDDPNYRYYIVISSLEASLHVKQLCQRLRIPHQNFIGIKEESILSRFFKIPSSPMNDHHFCKWMKKIRRSEMKCFENISQIEKSRERTLLLL
jgi:hypothetical protein